MVKYKHVKNGSLEQQNIITRFPSNRKKAAEDLTLNYSVG